MAAIDKAMRIKEIIIKVITIALIQHTLYVVVVNSFPQHLNYQ